MDKIERIKKYVEDHKCMYGRIHNLEKFFGSNPDIKEYVYDLLEKNPWFENIQNVLCLISKGIFERRKCKTCGKELSINACKNMSVYCSGRCKSKDPSKIEEEANARKEREKIYEIDSNINIPQETIDSFISNGSKPSDIVHDKIKEFAEKDKKGMGLYKLLTDNKDVDEYLTLLVKAHPWMEQKKRAFWFAKNELYEGKRCKACGKLLTYNQIRYDHLFCSDKCSNGFDEIRDRVKETCRKRYGGDNPMCSDDIRKKIKMTFLEKYGVENASQVEEFKEKRFSTMMERYGVKSYFSSKECRVKTATTSLERYGVDHPMKSQEVKNKQKKVFLEKYGVDNPSKTDEVKKKIVENTKSIRYKTIVERYSGKVIPMFTEEEYVRVQKMECLWKCVKCGTVFENHRSGNHSGFRRGSSFPLCPVCYPPVSEISQPEKELLDFIREIYKGEVTENCRNVITPLELDIYVPEKKIAIEFDGLYWHSDACGKSEQYHLEKTKQCLKKGVRLVHVFEDEWKEHKEIVKDRIKSIFAIEQNKIFARKCIVKNIDSDESNDFLEGNHLQGGDNSLIRYGLFYNNELVSVMTFGKPRFNRNYDWELIRFASKLGIHVTGGASKLLAHFKQEHSGSIISYADRRYSDGDVYEKLGFRLNGVSKPNYWYVKKNVKLSRYNCQKHKLPALLGDDFDPLLSESENMTINGWSRIYDCGNLIYVMD